jgi:hypothetical protein
VDFNAVKWGWTAASVRHGQAEFGRAWHGPEAFGDAGMRATNGNLACSRPKPRSAGFKAHRAGISATDIRALQADKLWSLNGHN